MLRWIANWWHARQRAVDLEILWPACKANAPNMAQAKMAFAVHAFRDEAWLCLGHDDIVRRIDELA